MNITKTFLANIPDCYAVAEIPLHDKNYILFASEGDDVCLAYSLPDLSETFTVWEHPGGTMVWYRYQISPANFLRCRSTIVCDWKRRSLYGYESIKTKM